LYGDISDVAGSVVDSETTCWLSVAGTKAAAGILKECWATDRGIMVVV